MVRKHISIQDIIQDFVAMNIGNILASRKVSYN